MKNYQLYEDLTMAKIVEEIVILRVSKLLKNKEDSSDVLLANNEFLYSLEQVATELLGDGITVEIERGD
jgi:hypothetical protein